MSKYIRKTISESKGYNPNRAEDGKFTHGTNNKSENSKVVADARDAANIAANVPGRDANYTEFGKLNSTVGYEESFKVTDGEVKFGRVFSRIDNTKAVISFISSTIPTKHYLYFSTNDALAVFEETEALVNNGKRNYEVLR